MVCIQIMCESSLSEGDTLYQFSFRFYLQEQLQLWALFKPNPPAEQCGGLSAGEVQHSKALCLKAIVWAFQGDRTSISKIIE